MKLKLLGVDESKDWFAIFYIERGEKLNAYVWSYVKGGIQITDVYGMERFCRHSVSGIYVGKDMPEDLIKNALENLRNTPEEELREKLEAFNERDSKLQEYEDRYKEREEYEDACLKDILSGNYSKDGIYWFM